MRALFSGESIWTMAFAAGTLLVAVAVTLRVLAGAGGRITAILRPFVRA